MWRFVVLLRIFHKSTDREWFYGSDIAVAAAAAAAVALLISPKRSPTFHPPRAAVKPATSLRMSLDKNRGSQ